MSNRLDLKVGDHVRHIKRRSVYRIVGRALFVRDLFDGDTAVLWNVEGGTSIITREDAVRGNVNLMLHVSFQRSILYDAPYGINHQHAFVYKGGEGSLIFARPEYEFTEDRFEVLP